MTERDNGSEKVIFPTLQFRTQIKDEQGVGRVSYQKMEAAMVRERNESWWINVQFLPHAIFACLQLIELTGTKSLDNHFQETYMQ